MDQQQIAAERATIERLMKAQADEWNSHGTEDGPAGNDHLTGEYATTAAGRLWFENLTQGTDGEPLVFWVALMPDEDRGYAVVDIVENVAHIF